MQTSYELSELIKGLIMRSFIVLFLTLNLLPICFAQSETASNNLGSSNTMLYGIIDTDGKVILPIQYESIGEFEGHLAKIKKDGKIGCIDRSYKIIIPTQFDDLGNIESSPIPAKQDNKWGAIDQFGHWVFKPILICDDIGLFSEGIACFSLDGKYGFVNSSGTIVVPPKYFKADDFHEGLAAVKEGRDDDSLWGYINKHGEWALMPKYISAYRFSEGLASVVLPIDAKNPYESQGGIFIINKNGQEILNLSNYTSDTPPVFQKGTIELSHIWECNSSTNYVYVINRKGKVISERIENRVDVYEPSLIGLTDEEKEYAEITKIEDHLNEYQEETAIIESINDNSDAYNGQEKLFGFVNSNGATIVQPQYELAHNFTNGIAWVRKNGLWGCIDKTGHTVIPTQYISPNDEFYGWMCLQTNEGFTFLNRQGERINKTWYSFASNFTIFGNTIVAEVQLHGKSSYINQNGNAIIGWYDSLNGSTIGELQKR
jgi:hypothetical protein